MATARPRSRLLAALALLAGCASLSPAPLPPPVPSGPAAEGRVTRDGVGVPGAEVLLLDPQFHLAPERPPAARGATGPEGHFRLSVPDGTYLVLARGPSAFAYFGRNPVRVSGPVSGIHLPLLPAPAATREPSGAAGEGVRGRVLHGGQPVEGARVFAYLDAARGLRGPGYAVSEPTGTDGAYLLPLPPGTYFLAARFRPGGWRAGNLAPGDYFGAFVDFPAVVGEGEALRGDIETVAVPSREQMGRFHGAFVRLSGRVVDGQGRPLAGFRACLYPNPQLLGAHRPRRLLRPGGDRGRHRLPGGAGGVGGPPRPRRTGRLLPRPPGRPARPHPGGPPLGPGGGGPGGAVKRLALALFLAGCAAGQPGGGPVTLWEGEVLLTDDAVFPRGSRLVLKPGTVVRFAFVDRDGDGWGDLSLRVEGDLVAQGTPEAPVVFTSDAAPAEPGGWGELRIDFGSFDLRHAVIEGSTRGLHAHFSRGRLRDSVLRRNVDGTRLGESAVTVEHCLFYGHLGKALNARRCRNQVRGNLFRHNQSGVFLFEGDSGSTFAANAFRENERPFVLGDFFEGTVSARGNDWGGQLPAPPEEPGAVLAADHAPAPGAGPRGWPFWQEAWRAPVEGFADADPRMADEGVYVASWGGEVLRLGVLDGRRLAAARLPDAVDGAVALGPGFAAALAWDRGIHLLGRPDLRPLDTYAEAPSPADDHRQAAPLFAHGRLYAGTWAGRVLAFDPLGGRLALRWSARAEGPFRAGLAEAGDLVLAPCQDGQLYAFDGATGRLAWQYDAGAPLLSGLALGDGTGYLGDRAGTLHAVDLATGEARWRRALPGPAWHAPPLLAPAADGVAVVQGDDRGHLSAFDAATGRPRWQTPLGAGIRARPALLGTGHLAVPTVGGRLVLIDGASGLERDAWELGAASLSSPAAAGDRVVLGVRDGSVRALDARLLSPGPETSAPRNL